MWLVCVCIHRDGGGEGGGEGGSPGSPSPLQMCHAIVILSMILLFSHVGLVVIAFVYSDAKSLVA